PGWLTKTISGTSINNYLSGGAMSVRYYEGNADTVQDNIYIDYVVVETAAGGTGSITQTTWTGGSGENTGDWSSKFWISENIDWENQAGDLKMQGTTSYENYGNRFIDNDSVALLNLDITSKEVSFRFTAQASKTVENVRVYVNSKVGVSPGSTYTVSLHSNSGGNPGTQLSSGTLSITGTPPRWEVVHLSPAVALTAGSVYHIKVKATSDPFANSWAQTRWQERGHEFWNPSYDNWFWDNYQVSFGENITLGQTTGAEENIGNFFLVTTTGSMGTLENDSAMASMKFTAQETKYIGGVRFYVEGLKGQPSIRVSLYSDSAGNPGSELAYGTTTISSTGWQSVNFTAPVQITQGSIYHIVLRHVNNSPGSWVQTAWTTQTSPSLQTGRWSSSYENFYTRENVDISQTGKIRLENIAVTHVRLVGAEPATLIDGTTRRGTVISGSYASTQAQDGSYEVIGEQDIGGTAYNTETDYEAATQVVAGTEVGGTSTNNLDVDDGTYYEVDAASSGSGAAEWYYFENNTRKTTTSTSWQWFMDNTINIASTGTYLVTAKASVDISNKHNRTLVRFLVDGVQYGQENFATQGAAGGQNTHIFAAHRIVNLTAGNHNFRMEFALGNAVSGTAGIENGRIFIAKVTTGTKTAENMIYQETTSTSLTDGVTLSDTFLADNYLLLATAGSSTRLASGGLGAADRGHVQVEYDATSLGEWARKTSGQENIYSFFLMKQITPTAGSHTAKIRYNSAATTSYARLENAVLSMVKLSDLGGSAHYTEVEGPLSTTSTTPVDAVTLSFTTSADDEYIIMGSGIIGMSSISYLVQATLEVDGLQVDNSRLRPNNAGDNIPFFGLVKRTLGAGSHTIKIRYWTSNATGVAMIKNARILAVGKSGAAATYSLDVRHDSGQVTASQSNVDNIYVKLNFKSTATATYTWQIYDFTNSSWLTLNSGSVGTTEVTWENTITVNPANYISDVSGQENIRVRIFTSNENSAHRVQEDYLVYKVNYHTTVDYRLN
ncbi:MAG: DUF4082 domain-containing protein, partial [Candidatus Hadarchaeales archaeon]